MTTLMWSGTGSSGPKSDGAWKLLCPRERCEAGRGTLSLNHELRTLSLVKRSIQKGHSNNTFDTLL